MCLCNQKLEKKTYCKRNTTRRNHESHWLHTNELNLPPPCNHQNPPKLWPWQEKLIFYAHLYIVHITVTRLESKICNKFLAVEMLTEKHKSTIKAQSSRVRIKITWTELVVSSKELFACILLLDNPFSAWLFYDFGSFFIQIWHYKTFWTSNRYVICLFERKRLILQLFHWFD